MTALQLKTDPHFGRRRRVAAGARSLLIAATWIVTAASTRSLYPTAAAQDDAAGNGVVAVVNADPISEKTLAEETLRRYGNEVLDGMINRYLILQACQSRGIEVTSDDVRAEIQRSAAKFKLDTGAFLQLLKERRQISPNQYGNDVVWPMLALRRLVADQIEVTEEEFNKVYLSQYGEAVKCRMILVKDYEQAVSLRDQAVADPDSFETLAKKHSIDEGSASIGGLLPPIRRYTGDAQIEDAVFALGDGTISDVLPLGDQWMILQGIRRMPAATPMPQSMPLIRQHITDQLRDEKVRVAAGGLFQELQAEGNVVRVMGDAELTKQHPGVAALINGQPLTMAQVAMEAVQRHGKDTLEGEINRRILLQSLKAAGVSVQSSDLDAEVRRAAVNFGFMKPDGTADVDAWMASVTSDGVTTRDIYLRDAVWPSVAIRKLVAQDVTLTENELQEGFQANYGPRVEVLAIVLGDQRTAQKVWQMARDNPTDAFFGQLAEQYSVEPVSSANAGKVPPIRKHGGQPSIEREAFSLKPGDLSGIISTGDQYVILRCQGYTEPVVRDFNAVREELTRDLNEKKFNKLMAEKFDELKKNAEVENFLAIPEAAATAAAPKLQQQR